jgi:hypothetical protein
MFGVGCLCIGKFDDTVEVVEKITPEPRSGCSLWT